MQINTRAAYLATTARMAALRGDVDRASAEIASGKRLTSADVDPVAAARATGLHRVTDSNAAAARAIDRAASRLSATDTVLDGVGTLLGRATELALAGNSATLNAADRGTLAAEAAALGEQLLGYANRRDSDGGALFAGARRGSDAYGPDAGGAVVWQGAGAAPVLVLGGGSAVATGVEGPAAFAGLADGTATPADAFALLARLQAALTQPDPELRNGALEAC